MIVATTSLGRDDEAMLKEESRREQFQRTLAKNFSQALDEGAATPGDIADALGITEQAVSNWKRTGKIATENIPTICRLTGWGVAQLMGLAEQHQQTSSVVTMPRRPSLRSAVDLIADQLDQLSPEQRDVAQGLMHALARTPRAQLVRECFVTSLAGDDSTGNQTAVHR